MKVVPTKDVKGAGRAHEVVTVADGHALNFLIPKRFAIPATAPALKEAESRKKQADAKRALELELVSERLAALIEEKPVIRKKVNEKGHLYDAVDVRELAELAKIPENIISIEKPFKEVGTFEVPVVIGGEEKTFPIVIEAE